MTSKKNTREKIKVNVSVVIPIHNSARFLPRLFHSLQIQEFKEFEVLIVDDNSKDNGDVLAIELLEKAGIEGRVIKSTASGPGSARNTGIAAAKTDFVTFVDSDDYILHNHLSTLISKVNSDTDIIEGLFLAVDERGNVISKSDIRGHLLSDRVRSILTGKISAVSWGKLYRRKMLLDNHVYFPEQIHNGEDHIFSIYAYSSARKIACSFSYTYMWCRRENSLTRRKIDDKYLSDMIFVSKVKIGLAKNSEMLDALKQRLDKQYNDIQSQIIRDHGKNSNVDFTWFKHSWKRMIESDNAVKEG